MTCELYLNEAVRKKWQQKRNRQIGLTMMKSNLESYTENKTCKCVLIVSMVHGPLI